MKKQEEVGMLDEVMEFLSAAETLGLGVRLHNERRRDSKGNIIVWVLSFESEIQTEDDNE